MTDPIDSDEPRQSAGPARWLAWLGRHELATLILLALIAGGIWGFWELAEEVTEGEAHALDERVLLAMRNPADPADPLGPKWMEEVGRDFTALGSVGVLGLLTLIVAGFLALQGKVRAMLLLLAAVLGGLVLSTGLKLGFDRPRPDLVSHYTHVYTSSFPSGHAMLAAATYLTLGALLARVQPRRRLKAYLLLIAMLLTFLVGISRIYMGVHWPTDVLAGWMAGAAWAMFCWLVARWLQYHGHIEEPMEETWEQDETGPAAGKDH